MCSTPGTEPRRSSSPSTEPRRSPSPVRSVEVFQKGVLPSGGLKRQMALVVSAAALEAILVVGTIFLVALAAGALMHLSPAGVFLGALHNPAVWIAAGALFLPMLWGVSNFAADVSPSDRQQLQEKMEQRRLDDVHDLAQRFDEKAPLRDLILSDRASIADIRRAINDILKSNELQTDSYRQFVQQVAICLQSSDGDAVLQAYAEHVYGNIYDGNTCSSLAELSRKSTGNFRRSGLEQAAWFAANVGPSSPVSGLLQRGKHYNAHAINPSHLGPRFGTTQTICGPTPTGDAVWEKAVLPGYGQQKQKELYIIHEDNHKGSERARIGQSLAAAKSPNCDVVVMGFEARTKNSDVQRWLRGKDNANIDTYIDLVRTNCRDRSVLGIEIPKGLLSDDALNKVLESAKTYLTHSRLFELSPKDQRQAIMMMVDALLEAALIQKHQPDYVRMCCKQHVDRGNAQMLASWIVHRAHGSNAPFSADESKMILGHLAGRPVLVDDRQMLGAKRDRLIAFLRLIGDDHEGLHKCVAGAF